ncbi:MAG: (4Fe-4S)-binding protein [Oscillospiraceae bacterium]|jgi:dissimilatory sulfite reductase (desulfoviridin) alpha/beta subunit|nr:(4Fe-4S)-binding protein [Oscillospiraceae bacterium]
MATLTVSAADEKRVKALGFLSNKGTDNFSGRIITVNGKITAEQHKKIAEAAEKFGNGNITFTTRLTIEVQGIPYEKIEDFRAFLREAGLETGGTGSLVRPVVACKGTTCQYGLLDSFGLSEEIHRRFYEGYHTVRLPHKFKIAVGGCPNNCVKPDLNDLGIIGQYIPKFDEDECNGCKKCSVEAACPMGAAKLEDGVLAIDKDICNNCGRCVGTCHFDALSEGTYGYKIYIGGRWGKKVAQGRALSKIFTDKEEALSVIEKAILLFREQGQTGERFAKTIERLGFENVEKQLLDNGLLERRQAILDAQLHLTGGATC